MLAIEWLFATCWFWQSFPPALHDLFKMLARSSSHEPLAMASSSQRSSPWAISKNLAMARFSKISPWWDLNPWLWLAPHRGPLHGPFPKISPWARFSKISPWRDFQSFAMVRFLKPGYGEIHSGIVSIFLDYATREGHLQGEKKIRKRKRKGKVMMAKTRPVKGWGPK